jgi:hypothetical protein
MTTIFVVFVHVAGIEIMDLEKGIWRLIRGWLSGSDIAKKDFSLKTISLTINYAQIFE